MKKIVLLVVLALAGVMAWYFLETKPKPNDEVPRQQPVAVSKYSIAFNQSIGSVLTSYYALSEAFVNWDSAAVLTHAATLQKSLDSIQFEELKKDTLIHQTAISYVEMFSNDLKTIQGATDLTTKRQAFNSFSQNLYDLLRTIRYDGEKVYLQQCPMAFNDTEEGLWLSKTEEIRNPYLGKHHPKYKAGMLACGETKATLDLAQTGR